MRCRAWHLPQRERVPKRRLRRDAAYAAEVIAAWASRYLPHEQTEAAAGEGKVDQADIRACTH
jgi:hypothetical protein